MKQNTPSELCGYCHREKRMAASDVCASCYLKISQQLAEDYREEKKRWLTKRNACTTPITKIG